VRRRDDNGGHAIAAGSAAGTAARWRHIAPAATRITAAGAIAIAALAALFAPLAASAAANRRAASSYARISIACAYGTPGAASTWLRAAWRILRSDDRYAFVRASARTAAP
jgi:hypothetical protein